MCRRPPVDGRKEENMDKEYVKSMIQQALWNEYARTENKDYKAIYKSWYKYYNNITIKGLEVTS